MTSPLSRLFKDAKPQEAAMLPGNRFFVRRLTVEGEDVPGQVNLALEAISPFPLEQMLVGFVTSADGKQALAYAAHRRRFTAEESFAWPEDCQVVPEFLALCGHRPAAGGIVVHMTSGWSALLLCILVGPRAGFGKRPMTPHSMVLCVIGTGLLWAGWYGFNAGSALAADSVAVQAFLTTTLGAATATLAWAVIEKLHRGKISVLGLCSGAIAGLATVTNAAGFVSGGSAVLIGALAGFLVAAAARRVPVILDGVIAGAAALAAAAQIGRG